MLEIKMFGCLNDNYGYLIKDEASQKVATIDTPCANSIIKAAYDWGVKIDYILNTHWHPDHAGGNQQIKDKFGSLIYGPKELETHGFIVDEIIENGDLVQIGQSIAQIIDLSGHTIGQIGYNFAEDKKVFVGDAMFALGCGRLFEGNAKMAWDGLNRLMALNDDTLVYCAHEYSAANARFCESLGLSNINLKNRISEIYNLTEQKIPTVPFTLGLEKATSPFLLADKENLFKELNFENKNDVDAFAFIRSAKDNFK